MLHENHDKIKRKGKFILRIPTGKQAEEYFISHYNLNKKPVVGVLKDTRDLGCGYDFEILSESRTFYIEVKGLSEIAGGIVFTNKEWNMALVSGDSYYLVIVKNLGKSPEIIFLQNPTLKLNAKKSIYTTIQVQWSVSENDLRAFK